MFLLMFMLLLDPLSQLDHPCELILNLSLEMSRK